MGDSNIPSVRDRERQRERDGQRERQRESDRERDRERDRKGGLFLLFDLLVFLVVAAETETDRTNPKKTFSALLPFPDDEDVAAAAAAAAAVGIPREIAAFEDA